MVRIKGPQSLMGTVRAPGSKAYTHRALVASLLSQGETIIQGASECDDAHRTLEAIRSLGARVKVQNGGIVSSGTEKLALCIYPIDCGESGASLRFLTAIAGASPTRTTLRASEGLVKRRLEPLLKAMVTLCSSTMISEIENGSELKFKDLI